MNKFDLFAIKLLKKSMINSQEDIDYANFEISVGKALKHDNVSGIEYVIVNDYEIILVIKFSKGKDLEYQLKKKLENDKEYMTPYPIIIKWAKQLMLGL